MTWNAGREPAAQHTSSRLRTLSSEVQHESEGRNLGEMQLPQPLSLLPWAYSDHTVSSQATRLSPRRIFSEVTKPIVGSTGLSTIFESHSIASRSLVARV